jgi:hypothetical protein
MKTPCARAEIDYIMRRFVVKAGRALMRMKACAFLIPWMAAGLLPLCASPASGFSVVSPDRPAIWFNRSGQKVSQELSWDEAKQRLVLYLSYDTIQNWPTSDQWYYDNFKLSFPEVRLNEATNSLYFVDKSGRRFTLGHLEDGAFGKRVVLEDGVQLVVHRANDEVHASILSAGGAARKPMAR